MTVIMAFQSIAETVALRLHSDVRELVKSRDLIPSLYSASTNCVAASD